MKKLAFSTLMMLGLVGCAPVQQVAKPNPTMTARCSYPVVSAMPETKELQTKGGINISLAPDSFKCVEGTENIAREIPASLGQVVAFSIDNPKADIKYYKLMEIKTVPVLKVTPEKLAFRVKINNQMPRVFRGAGTVVLYNFGGHNASVSSHDYAELSSVIVPPRTEAEAMIYGPPISDVPPNTPLGIFLYDVVTKTDKAGNVTEKQNFEWYYKYELQTKEVTREVTTKTVWMAR